MSDNWGYAIKQLREDKHMTQPELAQKSGVKLSWLSRVELGHYMTVKPIPLEKLARGLEISITELRRRVYGIEDSRIGSLVDVPHLGFIAAGIPVEETEQNLGTLKLPSDLLRGKNMSRLFALTVSGDSLSGDGITNGDIAIVEKDADIINGKIYVVKLEGQFVARHVWKRDDHLRLMASNGDYKEILTKDAEIKGRIILSGNWLVH